MKLKVENKFPDFLFDTPSQNEVRFYEHVKSRPATVVFLRDADCPFTTYYLEKFSLLYRNFVAQRRELVCVVQGSPAAFKIYASLPYPLVCDAFDELYRTFQLPKAKGRLSLLSLEALRILENVKSNDLLADRSLYKNLQLPVTVMLNPDKTIESLYCGKSITDIPKALDLLGGLQSEAI